MSNPFITQHAAEAAALVEAALPLMSAEGDINWKLLPDAVRPFNVNGGQNPIGYSRAWLIVRRACLEATAPKALVTLPEVADGEARKREWSKVITPMRDDALLSWGEIAVRCGVPESKVRTCYRATGAKKDVGLRIGKGGRFAYGEPEFYLEHRKAEGAMIPAEIKGKPQVEQLLNAKDAQGKLVALQRAQSKAKARVAAKGLATPKNAAPAGSRPAKRAAAKAKAS